MNKAHLIKKELERSGSYLILKDGDWQSVPFRACLTHLWRRKTYAFEAKFTEIGKSFHEYYLYVGPYDHNIKSLSDNALVVIDGEDYEFKYTDEVRYAGEVIYYTGVLRKIKGDENYENG